MKRILLILTFIVVTITSYAQVSVYKSGGKVRIEGLSLEEIYINTAFDMQVANEGNIRLIDGGKGYNLGAYTNVRDKFGDSFASESLALNYLAGLTNVDVNIQDQTTPPVDLYFIQALGAPTTLSSVTAVNDTFIVVTSTTNFVDGTYIAIFKPADNRFYFAEQLGAPNVDTLYIDTPLDYVYEIGDNVLPATREMNVDGSATPQIFQIQGAGSSATVSIDITRLIITMTCSSLPDDGLFGNLAALTDGIILRRVNGTTQNIWNAKSNGDLANLSYDVQYTTRSVPQGSYGVRCRYTFAGQDKHGVALRLEPGDALQLIIHDGLETLLTFRIIGAGHVVEN